MRYVKKSSEEEMIACFLSAEFNSPRFKIGLKQFLVSADVSSTLFTKPNLLSKKENRLRAKALDYSRAYLRRRRLFRGYPGNIRWHLVEMYSGEVKTLLYLNHKEPIIYTKGSRRVQDLDLGQNFDTKRIFKKSVEAIISYLKSGQTTPPIIVVSKSLRAKKRVILEGHARASAFSLIKGRRKLQVLLGVSPKIDRLAYW